MAGGLAVALCVCSGCTGESKGYMYGIAEQAIRADAKLPAGATVLPIEQANIEVLKSAARLDVPVEYPGPEGRTVRATYTVWLKRLAKDWVFDRMQRAPTYPPPSSSVAPPAPAAGAEAEGAGAPPA